MGSIHQRYRDQSLISTDRQRHNGKLLFSLAPLTLWQHLTSPILGPALW